MEIAEHIEAIRREGGRLYEAVERAALGTPVPTCPDWSVRDLVRHVGGVHRWAATIVAEGRTERVSDEEEQRLFAAPQSDTAILAWGRAGLAALLDALESAPPDLTCWAFLPAPTPLAFWARRQAHETTIHRADAESAAGAISPIDPLLAADGVDELLTGFVVRPGRGLRADPPRTLHVHSTDAPGEWLVTIGPTGVETRREHARGDCAVRGPASDLQLLLWNRRSAEGMEVLGDASVLDRWRSGVRVRW